MGRRVGREWSEDERKEGECTMLLSVHLSTFRLFHLSLSLSHSLPLTFLSHIYLPAELFSLLVDKLDLVCVLLAAPLGGWYVYSKVSRSREREGE